MTDTQPLGPWKFDGAISVSGPDGRDVAVLLDWGDGLQAKGMLIAAAPRMLGALRELAEHAERDAGCERMSTSFWDALSEAFSAITDATGGV